jgi:DNA-binding CsgD family transcriptional regulator
VRYRLLETTRVYAAEHLRAAGEAAAAGARHASWFLALAERSAAGIAGPAQDAWLDGVEAEYENYRAVLRRAVETGDAATGLRLAVALWRYWELRGRAEEGRAWLERLLRLPGAAADGDLRADALDAAGGLAGALGDYDMAGALHERSLALRHERNGRGGGAAPLGAGGRRRVRVLAPATPPALAGAGPTSGDGRAPRTGSDCPPDERLGVCGAAGTPASPGSGPLTPREREVAALIAAGLSNREIAGALTVTPRTAETHVTHILTKLRLARRSQVAAWALAHGGAASGRAL